MPIERINALRTQGQRQKINLSAPQAQVRKENENNRKLRQTRNYILGGIALSALVAGGIILHNKGWKGLKNALKDKDNKPIDFSDDIATGACVITLLS